MKFKLGFNFIVGDCHLLLKYTGMGLITNFDKISSISHGKFTSNSLTNSEQLEFCTIQLLHEISKYMKSITLVSAIQYLWLCNHNND